MSLTAGTLSLISVGNTSDSLLATAATGGTGPYTYQWYRSTASGFTPGPSNLLLGATSLALTDTGLVPGTQYYYSMIATDTGAGNATVTYAQLAVATPATLRSSYSGAMDTTLDTARQAGYNLIAVTNLADLTTQMGTAASHGQRKFTVSYVATFQPADLRGCSNPSYGAGGGSAPNPSSCGCGHGRSSGKCRCYDTGNGTGPLWPAYQSGILEALFSQDIMINEVDVKLNTYDLMTTKVDLNFHF